MLVINFALTFGISSISVGGHLGGFVVGLISGWLAYELPRQTKLPKYAHEGIVAAMAIVLFFAALWAATTWTDPVF